MRSPWAFRVLAVAAAWLGLGVNGVWAEEGGAANAAATSTPSAPSVAVVADAKPAGRGAVVVGLGDGAQVGAAKQLARDVYRDEALRASIEEPAARALVGQPVAEDAPPRWKELSALRATISASPDDVAARRLLASIGAELGAEIVVAVSLTNEQRPIARVLRVAGAQYEPVELLSTRVAEPGKPEYYTFLDVGTTLRRFVTVPVAAAPSISPPGGAIAPVNADNSRAPLKRPPPGPVWYKSPWFWAPLGVVVAAGAAIVLTTQLSSNSQSTVHVTGTVAP